MLDQCVLQVANKDEMLKVGKHFIEVATEKVKNNLELKENVHGDIANRI